MNILVTGGAGFIGSHLTRHLISQRHQVMVIDDFRSGKEENIQGIHPSPFVRVGDVRDWTFLEKAVQYVKPDFIFHLAATVGVNRVLENPTDCIKNNIDGVKAILRFGIPGIFTSTSEVYGKSTEPLGERGDFIFSDKPRWSYAASKLIGEWLALGHGWGAVRLFNVVGPRQSAHYGAVMPTFVRQALREEPITVYGDGTQVRSFLNVKDCVRMLAALMEKKFDVVNVGSYSHTITIAELAQKVKETLSGGRSEIEYIPYHHVYKEGFEECQSRVPNLSKLHSLIGHSDDTTLTRTIQEIASSMKGVMLSESHNTVESAVSRAAHVALPTGESKTT